MSRSVVGHENHEKGKVKKRMKDIPIVSAGIRKKGIVAGEKNFEVGG